MAKTTQAAKTPAKTAAKPAAKPAAKDKTSSDVVVHKKNDVVVAGKLMQVDFEEDAGAGFENVDKDSLAIPFIKMLQSGSPQVKKSHAEFIKGAEEGDFFNTVTKEVFPGGEGIDVIVCSFDRQFLEWAPKREGLRGVHAPTDPILKRAIIKEIEGDDGNARKALVLPGGNILSDVRNHFVLHVRSDGSFSPALISMGSSNIKMSKRLMTELNSLKKDKKNGTGKYTPPMYATKVHIGQVADSNAQGNWFKFDPALNGYLDVEGDAAENELYFASKAFSESISRGEVNVKHEDAGGDDAGGGEVEGADKF